MVNYIKKAALLFAALAVFLFPLIGCASHQSLESRLSTLAGPYVFNLADWQLNSLAGEIKERVVAPPQAIPDAVQTAARYFASLQRLQTLEAESKVSSAVKSLSDGSATQAELTRLQLQHDALRGTIESLLAGQIQTFLAEQGILNPFGQFNFPVTFPPLNFKLEAPLKVLIISQRDKIDKIQSVIVRPDMSLDQIQQLEAEADGLQVSSLVVDIGGLGATYPTFVVDNPNLRFILETAIHEWLHQYLAFKPLGFRYVLALTGVAPSYEITTLNETVASVAARELGDLVYAKYYSSYTSYFTQYGGKIASPRLDPGFDFNKAMRDIRLQVDQYLARGEVSAAERYMEEQRLALAARGYFIRKLNQAYFAFHGSYADSATSVNPIGAEVRQLRAQSPSIKAFLDRAASLTSREDLINLLK